jgi:hypothetical protein
MQCSIAVKAFVAMHKGGGFAARTGAGDFTLS